MVLTERDSMILMAHEGERIRELVERAGKKPSDFARACGVTRTAVDRYLGSAKIGKHAWTTVRAGLVKMGIDPSKVRPQEEPMAEEKDLRPLIAGWSREQLEALKAVLDAEQLAREKLSYYIDGLLTTRR
jgi:hypothetical protein